MESTRSTSRADAAAGPLQNVRVVEMGRFASAPSCATLLADWGAEVIKLEPPTGDPARGPGTMNETTDSGPSNPRFDVHNRSRRSVALDLTRAEARAAAHDLIRSADVFVTNLRHSALERLGMGRDQLAEVNPRLVYGHITGYLPGTSMASERSYDHGAFWSYSGMASLFSETGGEPAQPAGGLGDRASGTALAGAVCAALFAREATGLGEYVSTTLIGNGLWLAASDSSDALASGRHSRSTDRLNPPIATLNSFQTKDGRWLWLQVMLPQQQWSQLVDAVDAPELDDDPRFAGGDPAFLKQHSAELVRILDGHFAGRTLSEWADRLTASGLTWAPVRSLEEAVTDPELLETSAVRPIVDASGATHWAINSPCHFASQGVSTGQSAPRVGEQTAQVFRDLGYDEAAIESASGRNFDKRGTQ